MSIFDMTEAPASLDLVSLPHDSMGSGFTGSVEPDSLYLTPQVMHPTSALLTPPELSHSPPLSTGFASTSSLSETGVCASTAALSLDLPSRSMPTSSRSPRKGRRPATDEHGLPMSVMGVSSASRHARSCSPTSDGGASRTGKGYVPSYLTEEPQDCKVCLDVATGYHYRVLTCEGCKGFFRRTVQKNLRYSCRWNNDCVIDRNTRNNCQRCRFEKCLRVGMATDMVLDAKQRDQRAKLIDDNRLKRQYEEVKRVTESRIPKITESDRTVITNLTTAYDDCLSRGRQIPRMFQNVAFHQELVLKITELEICALLCKSDSVTENDVQETKELHPGLFNVLVEKLIPSASRVISFASCVPGFMSLHPDDQTVLLKDGLMEVLTLWNAYGYNEATENLSLIFGRQISGEAREHDYPLMSMLEPIIKFARGIIPFHLDKTEVALLSALILLQADRPGLVSCEPVDALQSNILFTFERYVRHQYHQNRIRWPKLLMKITELRTVSAAYAERTLTIKLDSCPALPRVFTTVFSDELLPPNVPAAQLGAIGAISGPLAWNSNPPNLVEGPLLPQQQQQQPIGAPVILPDTSYPSRPRSFS